MPYLPPHADLFAVPKWEEVHKDLHKRWISTRQEKLRGHMWDFGGGGYVLYGSRFDNIADLKAAAIKLGLSEFHVDTASGQIKVGDLVLAYITKAEFERRRNERLDAARDRDTEAVDAYLSQERKGVKPRVYESEEQYKDEKEFATRESNNRTGYTGRSRR